jgi:hypothetical protein
VITKYVRRLQECVFKLNYAHGYVTLKMNQIKRNSKFCGKKNVCSHSSSMERQPASAVGLFNTSPPGIPTTTSLQRRRGLPHGILSKLVQSWYFVLHDDGSSLIKWPLKLFKLKQNSSRYMKLSVGTSMSLPSIQQLVKYSADICLLGADAQSLRSLR